MDPASSDELYQIFVEFDKEESARVAVLSGGNGYFCAGYDLRYAEDLNVRIERGEYEFDPNQPVKGFHKSYYELGEDNIKVTAVSLNIDKGIVEPKIFFMLLSSSLPIQTPTT